MRRSYINKISKKKVIQMREEVVLKQQLLIRCKGLCEICGNLPDWRGLSKHEIKSRAQGGDPLDPDNCLMTCGKCHSGEHHIKEL